MPEFLNLLDTNPERLRDYQVRRETWRGFTPTPTVEAPKTPSLVLQRLGIFRRSIPAPVATTTASAGLAAVPAGTVLKLYQPAHQRHYLVACSLVCKVPGLPDRGLEPGRGEQTAFVIRRLLPPASGPAGSVENWDEHAWVAGQHGFAWRNVGADPLQLVDDEERLPLFAVQFAENDRRRRRLLAGVIPVGKREAYLGGPKASGTSTSGVTPRTSRKILLRKEVVEPWKGLVRRALGIQTSFSLPVVPSGLPTPPDRLPTASEKKARLKLEREQIQTVSWFVLLDFAKYLSTYLKPVWRAVIDPSRQGQLTVPERDLFDALTNATISLGLRETLRRDAEVTAGGTVLYPLADVPASLREALAKFGTSPEGLNTELERRLESIDLPTIDTMRTAARCGRTFCFRSPTRTRRAAHHCRPSPRSPR